MTSRRRHPIFTSDVSYLCAYVRSLGDYLCMTKRGTRFRVGCLLSFCERAFTGRLRKNQQTVIPPIIKPSCTRVHSFVEAYFSCLTVYFLSEFRHPKAMQVAVCVDGHRLFIAQFKNGAGSLSRIQMADLPAVLGFHKHPPWGVPPCLP